MTDRSDVDIALERANEELDRIERKFRVSSRQSSPPDRKIDEASPMRRRSSPSPSRFANTNASALLTSSVVDMAHSSNSKAVLGALRVLQDKIRRLEKERSQFSEECDRLRRSIRQYKAEAENDRNELEAQLQLEQSRARTTKSELGSQNHDLQSRVSHLVSENEDLRKEVSALKSQHHTLQEDHREVRIRLQSTEQTLHEAQTRIVDLQTMARTKAEAHLKAIRQSDELRLRLENAVDVERRLRSQLEVRESQTHDALSSVAALNEQLVSRIDGSPRRKSRGRKAKNGGKKRNGSSTSLARRRSSTGPHSSRSVTWSKASGGAGGAYEEADAYLEERRMRRSDRDKPWRENAAIGRRASRASRGVSEGGDGVEGGHEWEGMPWIPGQAVGPSHNVYANAQMAMSDSRAFGTRDPDGFDGGMQMQQEANPMAGTESYHDSALHRHSSATTISNTLHTQRYGGDGSQVQEAWGAPTNVLGGVDDDALSVTDELIETLAKGGTLSAHSSVESERAINAVIASLENEFNALNRRYLSLLKCIQDPDASSSAEAADPALTKALAEMIELMQKKGKQISTLRATRQRLRKSRERSPMRYPDAAQRRVEAMRLAQRSKELAQQASPTRG